MPVESMPSINGRARNFDTPDSVAKTETIPDPDGSINVRNNSPGPHYYDSDDRGSGSAVYGSYDSGGGGGGSAVFWDC